MTPAFWVMSLGQIHGRHPRACAAASPTYEVDQMGIGTGSQLLVTIAGFRDLHFSVLIMR
jgi:hypothetical protein